MYLTQEGEKARQSWEAILESNPLPNAIYFHVKNQYVQLDSLKKIEEDIKQNVYVSEVKYPEAVVSNLNENISKLSIGLLVVALVIAI